MPLPPVLLARVVHVLGIVLWIGGVAFVTTVLIPAIRKLPPDARRIEVFEQLESRFAWQARITTVLTGASGLYMIHAMGAWNRYLDPAYWWVHLMTFVWLAFTVVLFALEPLFLHRWFIATAKRDSDRAFRLLQRAHWLLLTLSVVAIVGAVAGSRGFLRVVPQRDMASQPEAVILLHGLGRTDRSMRPLEERLTQSGFQVYNFRYASTNQAPEVLVDDLGQQVENCCTEVPALHFVGHSLGGILIRAYLAKGLPPNVGRVVMLAPPNHGSELVDALRESAAFRWALGPSAQQLGTNPESLPNRLPPPAVELGVIAGTGTVNPIGSLVVPDEDDGMVSLASTKLEGMTDFLVVPNSHAFIMRSEEVAVQVVHFLREGRFRHEASE